MKKIGILTFHKSINYGAYMQCYALLQRLKSDFPDCKVEVIDYATQRVFENYCTSVFSFIFGTKNNKKSLKVSAINTVRFLMKPNMLKEMENGIAAFKKDWDKLFLSEDQIITDDYETLFNKIKNKYDVVIVGSDGVWEFISYPFPNAYFLNADIGASKFSYAASSDRMYFDDITPEQSQYISNSLNNFQYIGIRDVATENFLHKIDSNLKINHNCDPTVFLDMENIPSDLSRVKCLLEHNNINLSKPIICIMGDDNIGKLIRTLFANKYQVVAIYTSTKYADYFLNDLTPLEWSKVFSLFAITFTRFFHGTILSLKNGTPTITIDPWKMRDEEHITKIHDLYIRMDLMEHYFVKKIKYSKEELALIEQRAEEFIKNPDRDKIAIGIAKEAKYYDSLKKALVNTIYID